MYQPAFFCKHCDHELSFGQVMDSHGVCPYCGHNDHSTVVDHLTKSVRVKPKIGLLDQVRNALFGNKFFLK